MNSAANVHSWHRPPAPATTGDGSIQQLNVDNMTTDNCTIMMLPAGSFFLGVSVTGRPG
jgi:hypothetical protein